MHLTKLVFALCLTLSATTALAHDGPRVWLDAAGGKLSTYRADNDLSPSRYFFSRLFVAPELDASPELPGVGFTDFPGFEARRPVPGLAGPSLPPGTTLRFRIAGPLRMYSVSGDEYLDVNSLPLTTTPVMYMASDIDAVASATGPVEGFDFFSFQQVGDHAHVLFYLASDTPGYFALPLTVSAPGLESSPLFHVLFAINAPLSGPQFDAAFGSAFRTLNSQVVPEPAALAAITAPLCLFARRRR